MALSYNFRSKDLVEKGKITQSGIQKIANWVQTSPLPQLQDEFISLFLLSCRNDVEATKKKIEAYFRITNGNPQVFNGSDIDSEDVQQTLKIASFCAIPKRLDDNYVVMVAKLDDPDYRKCDIVPLMRLSTMMLHLSQRSNPPNEVVVIVDINKVGFMHLTCLKIGAILAYLEYIQEALIVKLHSLHIVNANYLFFKVLNMFKSFLGNELLQCLRTYPRGFDVEDLHKEVPPSHLPKDYGGEFPFVKEMTGEMVNQIRKLKPFFEAEMKLRSQYKSK